MEYSLFSEFWRIEDLFKNFCGFFHELGTVGFQKIFVFEFLQSFRSAHVAIKQFPAYNGTVPGLEPVDELQDKAVGFLFRFVISSLGFPMLEPNCHHGAGHDTTRLTHAGHSSTKGTGYPQCLLPVKAQFLAKRGQNSLRSAKGFFEAFNSLCWLIHKYPLS